MITKTVTYPDLNGDERTEELRFGLSRPELVRMSFDLGDDFEEKLKGLIAAKDNATLIKIFEEILFKSYGVKSEDGRTFRKSEELSRDFVQSPAYDVLFMELITDAKFAAEFCTGILPANLEETVAAMNAKNNVTQVTTK